MGSLETTEICAELEAKLGRSATDRELERVAERLPEFYSRRQLRRIVARVAAIEKVRSEGFNSLTEREKRHYAEGLVESFEKKDCAGHDVCKKHSNGEDLHCDDCDHYTPTDVG